jgi:restriction system protein
MSGIGGNDAISAAELSIQMGTRMMNSNDWYKGRFDPKPMSPKEFEVEVAGLLEKAGVRLPEFRVQTLEPVIGVDGEYAIDVTARFEVLGMSFLVLVECKHHKNPIKREVVQILHTKLQSTGAQKGMIIATAGFQSGALEYAKVHGIALLEVADGMINCLMKSAYAEKYRPDFIPQYAAQIVSVADDGHELSATFHEPTQLLEALQIKA